MRPIATTAATEVHVGREEQGVEPLPVERMTEILPDRTIVSVLRSRWRLSDEERAAIVLGSDLVIDVFGQAMAPIRPGVTLPPDADLPIVAQLIDGAMNYAIAYSMRSALEAVGIPLDLDRAAAWSDEEKSVVAEWIRRFDGADQAKAEELLASRPEVLR